MKLIKNTTILLATSLLFSFTFALVNADNNVTTTKQDNTKLDMGNNISHFDKYYSEFKKIFYNELKSGDFSRIDEKIRGYTGDIEYLSNNPSSEHYIHLQAYKDKIRALKELKSNFDSNKSMNIENKDKMKEREYKERLEKQRLERERKLENQNLERKERSERLERQRLDREMKLEEQRLDREIKGENQRQQRLDRVQNLKENAQNNKIRALEIRDRKKELIERHRINFIKQLDSRLDNLSTDKLEKANKRIVILIERFENHRQAEVIIPQLFALKAVIDEKLEKEDDLFDIIDIEEIFGDL